MLPCPVVKDLLPSYLEGLTSPETNRAVEDHLDGCPGCRGVKNAMAAQVELDRAPQPRRDFLGEFKRHQHITAVLLVALTFVFTYVFILTLNRLVAIHTMYSLGLFLLIPLVCGTLIAWVFRRKRTLLVLFLIFLILDVIALTLVLLPFPYTLRIFMTLFHENNGEFIGMLLWLTILGCTGMAGGLGIGSLLGRLWRRRQARQSSGGQN